MLRSTVADETRLTRGGPCGRGRRRRRRRRRGFICIGRKEERVEFIGGINKNAHLN